MTEQPLDEAYKTIKDAIGAVQAVRHLAAEADTLRAEVERLKEALRNVIGMLDDPYGLEHVRDMRGATVIARAALAHGEDGK
tara:strand:- start:47 stop:292 length:246 start_codon:yes stop_codon:yes gene_type:complete